MPHIGRILGVPSHIPIADIRLAFGGPSAIGRVERRKQGGVLVEVLTDAARIDLPRRACYWGGAFPLQWHWGSDAPRPTDVATLLGKEWPSFELDSVANDQARYTACGRTPETVQVVSYSRTGGTTEPAHWIPLMRLGEGGQAVAWSAMDLRGHPVVLRKVAVDPFKPLPSIRALEEEMECLRRCAVPLIIPGVMLPRSQYWAFAAQNGFVGPSLPVALVQVLPCARHDLATEWRFPLRAPLELPQFRSIARNLLVTLRALHARGIWHRDVKPENLLVMEHGIRLTDFGLALPVDGPGKRPWTHSVQTLYYRAPENLLRLPADGRQDVWSVGILLASYLRSWAGLGSPTDVPTLFSSATNACEVWDAMETLTGTPTEATWPGIAQLRADAAAKGLVPPTPSTPREGTWDSFIPRLDPQLDAFLRGLLIPCPDRRWTADQALCHPFL